jgi:hypothetical protein
MKVIDGVSGDDATFPQDHTSPTYHETCPNDKYQHKGAADLVCGDRPRFFGFSEVAFNSSTANQRNLNITMPEYALSVSLFCIHDP